MADNAIEQAVVHDGKLFGIIPKKYEREVGFTAALITIVLFVLYLKNKNASTGGGGTSATDYSSAIPTGSSTDSGYYDSSESSTGTGTTSGSGTTSVATDPNQVYPGGNPGGLPITYLGGSQAVSSADTGTALTLDLSTLFQNSYDNKNTASSGSQYSNSSATLDQSSTGSASKGGGGLSILGVTLFGSGGTQNQNSTSNQTATSSSGQSQQSSGSEQSGGSAIGDNITASGTNLSEAEYNTLITTLANVHNNDNIANVYQTSQIPGSS